MCSYEESYEIDDDQIGSGQFGVVKNAKSKKQKNLKICVKILIKQLSFGKPELDKQQEGELKMCKDMINKKYENLVQIYDVYDSVDKDDKAYIFMERCDKNLRQLIEEQKEKKEKFSKEKLYCIIKQIVKGYIFLIYENIIHRDLKPENILCNINDKDLAIKIADFGLSKTCISNENMTKRVGTPYYRAPEIRDTENTNERVFYDNRCDIFSLGIIIFELALLEKQFKQREKASLQDQTFSELHKAILKNENFKLDEDIIKLLDKMIVYDPDKRITWQQLGEQFEIQLPPNIMMQPQQTLPTFVQFNPILNSKQTSPVLSKFPVNQQQQHFQNVAQEQTKPNIIQENMRFQKQNLLEPGNEKDEKEKIRFATVKQPQFNNFQQCGYQNSKFPNGQPLGQGLNGQQIQQVFKGQFPQPTIQKNQLQSPPFQIQGQPVFIQKQPVQIQGQPVQIQGQPLQIKFNVKDEKQGEQKQKQPSTQINNNNIQFPICPNFQQNNIQIQRYATTKPIGN